MSIEYTYNILTVDNTSKCMEVLYSSHNRQDVRISIKLPYKTDSLHDLLKVHAPVLYWQEQEREFQEVVEGTSGQGLINSVPESLEELKTIKLQELADWRYSAEVHGVDFNSFNIPCTKELKNTLIILYHSIKGTPSTNINFKLANGSFITLNSASIEQLLEKIFKNTQMLFDIEKRISDKIIEADSITKLLEVQLPVSVPKLIHPTTGVITVTEL